MRWQFITASAMLCAVMSMSDAKSVEIQTFEVSPSAEDQRPTIPTETVEGLQSDPPEDDSTAADPDTETAIPANDEPAQQVYYNPADLPKPVARMRDQMREAALSGDIERLRIVLESNEVMPTLSFAEIGDPIEFLKQSSGDGDGFEVLAILADTLDAGFVHVDVGTPQEMYIWPYFARYPLHKLSPDQKVELFRIVTSGDFAEMEDFGAWLFYRVGIGPDGTLHYFVAGD